MALTEDPKELKANGLASIWHIVIIHQHVESFTSDFPWLYTEGKRKLFVFSFDTLGGESQEVKKFPTFLIKPAQTAESHAPWRPTSTSAERVASKGICFLSSKVITFEDIKILSYSIIRHSLELVSHRGMSSRVLWFNVRYGGGGRYILFLAQWFTFWTSCGVRFRRLRGPDITSNRARPLKESNPSEIAFAIVCVGTWTHFQD